MTLGTIQQDNKKLLEGCVVRKATVPMRPGPRKNPEKIIMSTDYRRNREMVKKSDEPRKDSSSTVPRKRQIHDVDKIDDGDASEPEQG